MKKIIIACETIKNELTLASEKTGIFLETIWMANQLHDSPERLRDALQGEIDRVETTFDQILFAFGNCGNGLLGLKSEHAIMIIPKYGDCIDLFLSEKENLDRIRTTTYFLTEGWLKGQKTVDKEYEYTKEKYGEKRAKRVMDMMFKHYENLMLIDTGAYELESSLPRVNDIAELIDLQVVIDKGSISPFEKLLTGDWDEHFCVISPGQKTVYSDFEMQKERNEKKNEAI